MRTESLDPAILRAAVASLTAPGDLAGELLALARLSPDEPRGRSGPFRQMLLDLREHPDSEAREAARDTRPEVR